MKNLLESTSIAGNDIIATITASTASVSARDMKMIGSIDGERGVTRGHIIADILSRGDAMRLLWKSNHLKIHYIEILGTELLDEMAARFLGHDNEAILRLEHGVADATIS